MGRTSIYRNQDEKQKILSESLRENLLRRKGSLTDKNNTKFDFIERKVKDNKYKDKDKNEE